MASETCCRARCSFDCYSGRLTGSTAGVLVLWAAAGSLATARPSPDRVAQRNGSFTFVAADALTMKVREAGRVVNAVVLVVTAETGPAWNELFADLVARGLGGVHLVTSDAHAGLVEAVAANLPGASWQRCRTHYAANLMSICPRPLWPAVKAMLHSVDDQPDATAVHAQLGRLLDYVTDRLPEVGAHLDAALTPWASSPTATPSSAW